MMEKSIYRALNTTLIYIEREGEYLMLHRTKKENDCNRDKWIGIGGKFEAGESPEECALREAKEETGLDLTSYRYRGIVTFVSDRWESEYMHLFTADGFAGELKECDEGELAWIRKDDLLALPKGDKSKYVLQTLEYIAAHYADADINITTIARSIGISEGHLSHVFKKETSYTALGYLTLYRIHMARRLLADCRYKVYEVAGMVGYRDVAYFGSTFKKLTGLSPSEYQDRCR